MGNDNKVKVTLHLPVALVAAVENYRSDPVWRECLSSAARYAIIIQSVVGFEQGAEHDRLSGRGVDNPGSIEAVGPIGAVGAMGAVGASVPVGDDDCSGVKDGENAAYCCDDDEF